MIVAAAFGGPVAKVGVVVLGLLAAAALLGPPGRARAAVVVGALVLAPVLLAADTWHSRQLGVVHRHPAVAAAGVLVAIAMLAGLAVVLRRRRAVLAPLAILTLPFRVPITSGGTTNNLLLPLYGVIAVGALALVFDDARGARRLASSTQSRWLGRVLALVVVVYGAQATYSVDFSKALQQMAFFYVPFALLFVQLRELRWTRELLRACLWVAGLLAVSFAVVAFGEYATRTIIFNSKLAAQNELHVYFVVNSLFYDPDIFGRFLALVMIAITAALLYARRRGEQCLATCVLAVLWVALVLTLSRSSLAALLVGLGVLVAVRWRPSRAVWVTAAVVAAGAVAVAAAPRTFGLNQGLNGVSAGRSGLVGAGLHMFDRRPVTGYGSGSFVAEYRREHPSANSTLAASHTIAVTVLAEQGVIGEAAYALLVIVGVIVLLRGARGSPARAAIAAAFVALILHTNLYADFLEDPVTWTLLAIGAGLAAGGAATAAPPRREPVRLSGARA